MNFSHQDVEKDDVECENIFKETSWDPLSQFFDSTFLKQDIQIIQTAVMKYKNPTDILVQIKASGEMSSAPGVLAFLRAGSTPLGTSRAGALLNNSF
jgi:deoxyribose-phosphate aldolase